MRILHYTLGFKPYRSGGLPRYVADLMTAQARCGNEVAALYPGGRSFLRTRAYVRKEGVIDGVMRYELRNSHPVPLLYGVPQSKKMFDIKVDFNNFITFLDETCPDVLHVHTLMGLPIQLLEMAKERNIKIVFTTHDYFGICPKVNMIDYQHKVCLCPNAERCAQCNINAKDRLFLYVRNSKSLLLFKRIIHSIQY